MISLVVKTDGLAFLRNGYVNLTAIGVEFDTDFPKDRVALMGYSTRGAKSSQTGIGHEANGYFWIPLAALMELSQKILEAVPDDFDRQVAESVDGPERLIEMYVGRSWGGDGGFWDVVDVMVPAALPEKSAVALAGQKLLEMLDAQDVVFFGVYCYWTDEMMASAEMDEEE